MIGKLRLCFAGLLLVLASSFVQAAFVPISVYPNPAEFGTVAQYSSGYLVLYVSNVSANSVVVTSMSISGPNSGDFAFSGSNCVGTLGVAQTCQMTMMFTPSATGSRSANLLIGVQGLTQQITVSLDGTGGSPPPIVTSLSPPSVYVNSPTLTLTVNGSGFVSGAVVYWENNPLTTSYVSSTQLTAQVPASDLSGTGSDFVEVGNPDGTFSGFVYFYVVALDPSISNLSPTSVVAKSSPTPIIVNGNNFMTGATVLWSGKRLPTTYVNSSQLQVTPTAAQLASARIVQLSVSNPSPGGTSPEINFDVTYPAKVTILDVPANALVWDPYAQNIYASLPSSYGSQGNTIAVINPSTGKIAGYHFAGSEPNALALSSDAKYLYAGLNGNGSVQRLVLPKFTQDIDVSLGVSQFGGLNTALSLQVSPGDSHTFAVAEGTIGCCGASGLFFYKDATQLPDSITFPTFTDIVFANSSTLYGYSSGTVSDVTVNSSGGILGQQWTNLVEGTSIEYDAGLIYGSDGQVLNPATGLLLGTYDVSGGCCNSAGPLLPDSAINRVFALGNTPFFSSFGITSYDLSKFTPLAVTNLSQLTAANELSFLRWGNNGLAFILQPGCCGNTASQVVLVQSPAMLLTSSGTKNPLPVAQSLSPASATHGGWNFALTVQGKGFVPGSQVTWNGSTLAADYLSPTQLRVYVPATSIAAAGTANVVVTNTAPGGGVSGT
ncbi:MAG: IPT/TIG domain-containing protein, partial [Candidatus Sulfotelmatobacter sp.]